jgi:hypothetical protein
MDVNKMKKIKNKTEKNKNLILKSFLVLVVLLMVCSLISALGVGSIYSKKNPLEMYPGQEKVVFFKLENPDSDGRISIDGSLTRGNEIASLGKTSYKVDPGEQVYAEVVVKVPETASIGQTYEVAYTFSEVPEAAGGVSFSQSAKGGFDVIVVEKSAEPMVEAPKGMSTGGIVFIVILLVVIIAVVYLLLSKMKKK